MEKFALILKNVGRLISLSEREQEIFCSYFKEVSFPRKKIIYKQGQVQDSLYFINKGLVKIYIRDASQEEHIYQFADKDYWLGDIYSSITGDGAIYTAEALEPVECLQMANYDQERLFEEIPKFERFFRILVQRSYVSLQKRISCDQLLSSWEKFRALQEKFPGIDQRVTQKDIASYLGITPESFSRLKKESIKSYHRGK